MSTPDTRKTRAFVWNLISYIFSVVGTINLFGEIGTLSLADWMSNVLEAYRLLIHPFVEYVSWPLQLLFNIKFDSWHKDIVVVAFFFVDRFVADIVGIVAKDFFHSPPPSMESFRDPLVERYRWLRCWVVFSIVWDRKILRPIRKKAKWLTVVLKKLFTLLAVVAILKIALIAGPPTIDPTLPNWAPILWFFLAMYSIPILVGTWGLFGSMVYLVGYLLRSVFWIVSTIIHSAIKKRCPSKPEFNLKLTSADFYTLVWRQLKFDFAFTCLFLIVIGLNYSLLNK